MSAFQPRTMTVTLYQGDWQQRVDDARHAAERARSRQGGIPRTLDEAPDSDEYEALAAEYERVKAEALEQGAVHVTLQALPRRKWSELVAANPPRTDESVPEAVRKNDAEWGVNDEALGEAVVPLSIAKIEPEMPVSDLIDGVSSAQWDLLYGAAFGLNRGTGSDPKAAPSLTPSPSSSETGN